MSKARDIASAAPAPSTVSATELGYLDGVTSAIQTQLDAKTAASIVDAKGDLIAGSADNTVTKLTAGANGLYLATDSSTTSGLVWTTTPSGGGSAVRVAGNSSTTDRTATFSFVTGIYNVNIQGPIVNFTVGSKIVESTGVYSLPSTSSATISLNNQWVGYPLKLSGALAILYSDNLFLAVNGGTASTSPDGKVWTNRFIGQSAEALAYGNGTWVAAGDQGVITTSTDAITWTTRNSTTNTPWLSATFGTIFIVAGNSGGNATSTDGITWTTRSNILGNNGVNALTYGNGLYVAGGNASRLWTSTDALSWTSRDVGFGTISTVRALVYGNGLYVAGGQGSRISTSTDGITWTTRNAAAGIGNSQQINALAYGNGLYVVGTDSGKVATSTDGITWTSRPANLDGISIRALAYGADYYVAGGITSNVMISESGTTNTADDAIVSWGINSEIAAV